MQERVEEILDEISRKQIFLKHVALNLEATTSDIVYSKKHRLGLDGLYRKSNDIIRDIIRVQIMLRIPIVSVKLFGDETLEPDNRLAAINSIPFLMQDLGDNEHIHNNQVKVSILGKWYDLPGNVVDSIKNVMDETRSYDKFFFNLCMNYDGQEEIVSACKIIARKAEAEKLEPDAISKSDIKDNLYSSYFIPPDLIIKAGKKVVGDLMLWDISNARICFTGKHWSEFSEIDILRGIVSFQ